MLMMPERLTVAVWAGLAFWPARIPVPASHNSPLGMQSSIGVLPLWSNHRPSPQEEPPS